MYIHTGNLVSRADPSHFSFIDFFQILLFFFKVQVKDDVTKKFPIFLLYKISPSYPTMKI